MEYAWALIIINLISDDPFRVEGTYGFLECFDKREEYIPEYPPLGMQGVCVRMPAQNE